MEIFTLLETLSAYSLVPFEISLDISFAVSIISAFFSYAFLVISFSLIIEIILFSASFTISSASFCASTNIRCLSSLIHFACFNSSGNFSLISLIISKISSLSTILLPDELKHESFRWNLYKDSTQISSGSFQNATVGTDLLLTPYETITTTKSNYTLYIWIDGEHYDNPLTMGGKTFEFKLKLEASQQDYATAEECFEFDTSTQNITNYLCYSGNGNGLPTITDVVIPSSINGVSVRAIGSTTLVSSVSYLNKEKIIASPLANNLNKKPKIKLVFGETTTTSPFAYKNINLLFVSLNLLQRLEATLVFNSPKNFFLLFPHCNHWFFSLILLGFLK